MRAAAIAVLALCSSPASAADDAITAGRGRVAELVTLAKLAPLLCPDLAIDDEGVRGLMDHAGNTEADVMSNEAFGMQDQLVAHSFAQSVKNNALQSCRDIGTYLGPDGARLVKPKASQ